MLELLPGRADLTAVLYRLAKGVVWEPLDDDMHAVFSGLSGETHLLNTTAVWLLELLGEPGWHDPQDALHHVAAESGLTVDEVRLAVGEFWPSLEDLGLLVRQRVGASST